MNRISALPAALLAILLGAAGVLADDIFLRDGRSYSGKFVRGDGVNVEFRVQGKVETFRTEEIDRIVFREPELVNPPVGRTAASRSSASVPPRNVPTPAPPTERVMRSDNPAPPPVEAERVLRNDAPLPGAAAAEPARPTLTLPAGTTISVRTAEAIDSDRQKVGDSFMATLEDPLSVGSQVIAPRGTEVRGIVAYSQQAGRMSGRTELILELTELRLGGRIYPVRTSDYTESGASQGKRTAATVGGAAVLGAIIGAVAGGGKGAAVGAATGAAAGTAASTMSRGVAIRLPAESILDFTLQKPLSIEIP